jgi:hypothetical protein
MSMRSTNIRRAILDILEHCQPFALPESQLALELNAAIRPPAGKAEFDEEMLFLQTRGFIASVPDPLDDDLIKWSITEPGMAMLRK